MVACARFALPEIRLGLCAKEVEPRGGASRAHTHAYSPQRTPVCGQKMALSGKLVFGVATAGMGVGFFWTGMRSLDQLKDTDTRANQMISPSMPPSPPMMPPSPLMPPSPMHPPPPPATRRRAMLEQGSVFKFSEHEEKKILADVRSSILGMAKKH